jgi:hypothetical protein
VTTGDVTDADLSGEERAPSTPHNLSRSPSRTDTTLAWRRHRRDAAEGRHELIRIHDMAERISDGEEPDFVLMAVGPH